MDITVQREALLKPLQAVSSVVEKKQTLPILSNVMLTVKDDQLLLTGTDLEIELVGVVKLLSKESDSVVTVSAKKLFDICRALPEGIIIRLQVEKNYLIVRAGESRFKLNILPAENFPSLEACDYHLEFPLEKNVLKQLFTKTYFAMGQQDVRHYLNGTFLDISNGAIRCVATDGHRMALVTVFAEHLSAAQTKVIIPRKSVMELMRLLGADGDEMVNISIAEGRFRLQTSDYIFTSKLIIAQYPDYNRLIPKGTMVATGERETIKHALTRASILSSEKFRGVRFQLEPDKLHITANNSDQEHAEEIVPLEYSGTSIEIGFNVAYLLDIMSAISDKVIRCVFSGSNEGVLIEPLAQDQTLYVVMPMRL